MAFSDFQKDIGKVVFFMDLRSLSLHAMFSNRGHRWIQDAGRESDLTFVKEALSCESNGVFRFPKGHREGSFFHGSP